MMPIVAVIKAFTTGSVIAFPIMTSISFFLMSVQASSNKLSGRSSLKPVNLRSWGIVRNVPAAGR